jgi:hypothetical protein
MIGISLHWTAGYYTPNELEMAHYHGGVIYEDGRATAEKWNDYNRVLPHTYGRNGELIGLTVCAMANATTGNFGPAPVRPEQIDELCLMAAEVAYLKGIDTSQIRTHAEWAIIDGYGPQSGDRETRWDLSILNPGPCTAEIARKNGDELRRRIRALKVEMMEGRMAPRKLHSKNMKNGRPQ